MPNRKIIYGATVVLGILVLFFGFSLASSQNQELKVIFLDVGQGDAALITQGDKQVLIDGGPNGQVLMEKLGKYIPFWDRKIELVIATHPDQDHIQGLIDVLEKYQIDSVMETSTESDSQVYKKYKNALERENAEIIKASVGTEVNLEKEARIKILAPAELDEAENKKDTNAKSIVSELVFGKNSFLFAGDATFEEEKELLNIAENISADVLKIAHHGSKYSTSQEFLEKVRPREAIISVGKNNYGHPTEEILERLKRDKIRILRTDEEGDIEYNCYSFQESCSLAL